MKILFIISSFFHLVSNQSSIYDIQINTIDQNNISLSIYQGKKILVSEFDALNPNIAWLQYLDSLQMGDTSMTLIAVPAIDFAGTNSVDNLKSLRDSLNLHFIITLPANIKKVNGAGQDSLFNWLTNVSNNSHFDDDVDEDGQLFIISSGGTLYSILKKETPHDIITAALSQQIDQ